ncbi:MAG TPA: zinc ABC transporter substrate-binding protein, partial [Nitrospirae bacterium]|nr:zinc ABC transporter substrate-binding protein [Nitrospirota bacterium]
MFFSALVLCVSLYACQRSAPSKGNDRTGMSSKLKVLTTIPPLYSFAKNITGDAADVENLLPSGAGPHEYASSPADLKKIISAQVLIKNGAGLETWLDSLIASAGEVTRSGDKTLIVVDASSGIDIINNDPHIWLSPKKAVHQVKNIRDAMIKADPDNAELYIRNAAQYIGRLETLDLEIQDEIRRWKKKEFVAFHSAFLYFTRDYGLRQVAAIQEFPDKQPTPRHIADVLRVIKDTEIKIIFSDSQFSHKIVESIARDLDLRVLSLDTLETGELHPGWCENMMRKNVAA